MASQAGAVGDILLTPKSGNLPTVAQLSSYMQHLFPLRDGDTPFAYHIPHSNRFDVHSNQVSHAVLSITPTPGFYAAISSSSSGTPLAFLHRPWLLDRGRIPRRTTILSCHKGFDEVLTVGNNVALASTLGLDLDRSRVIRGYKGVPERAIGVVGPVSEASRKEFLELVKPEFPSIEGAFGFENNERSDVHQVVKAVAIMNAFHPEEVQRVLALASDLGLIPSAEECDGIVYLTGAEREQGLQAAVQKHMAVVCVGHRACEEWGIKYLADILRREWPSIHVDVILEAEDQQL